MADQQSKTVPVTGRLLARKNRKRSPKTFYNEDLGTPGMQAAAALVPGYELNPTKRTRSFPKVKITADEVFRLAQLQVTQIEAAGYFMTKPGNFERLLQTKPEMRDAWEAGLARGRVSFRRLGLQHASGTGAAAVAAWIHQSKFVLGYSEKLLNGPGGNIGDGPGEGHGALEQFFGRIARLVEQRAAAGITKQLVIEGGVSPGMELAVLEPAETDGAEPGAVEGEGDHELAHLDDQSGPRLREIADRRGDSPSASRERPIEADLAGGAHGVGHPRRDDRGPERDNADQPAVEPAEIRTDEA